MRLEVDQFSKILNEFPEIRAQLTEETNFRLKIRATEEGTID